MKKKGTKKATGTSGKRRIFSGAEGLSKATQRAYDTKDSFGGGVSYLKKDAKVKLWNCTDGEHLLDVIPYVTGDKDPNTKEGSPQYVLDIWVHRGVGALQQSYVCPNKNFKTRCPICEKQLQMRKSGDYTDEEVSSLNAKRRTMYNVFVWDSKEEIRKGVQVWEVSHFFFEKHLAELCKRPKGGGFIVFSDPDNGKSVSFKKKSKGSNMEFLGHRFEDRDEDSPVTDEMLDDALCLDELIHIPTLKELQKAVEDGFASEEDEKPRKGKGKKHEEEEEDEDYSTDEDDEDNDYTDDEEEEAPKKKGRKKAVVVEDDDDDEEEDDEEEEASKAKKGKKAAPAKKGKKAVVEDDDDDDDYADDDDDDDGDEEEEEEAPKKKGKKTRR